MSNKIYVTSTKRTAIKVSNISAIFLISSKHFDRINITKEQLIEENTKDLDTIHVLMYNERCIDIVCKTPRKGRLEFNKLLKMMEEEV